MAAYIASLRELSALGDETVAWLAPGHGFLMEQTRRAFDWIVRHRLQREEKVVDVLRGLGAGALPDILSRVYDDVPAGLHVVATRSLLAHLIKLRDEGRVAESAGEWRWLAR
jgi:hypothetical protein